MIESNVQGNRFPVKTVLFIVLLLTVLPLVLFILVQFMPPREDAPSAGAAAESAAEQTAVAERRAQRAENDMADFRDPDDVSVVGVGAVVPNAPRGKRATPYPPGEVPGDSGIVPNYAGSPDDPIGAPPPPPPAPQDDLWGGRPVTPVTPANMNGIGGVRRIDPNDPFFQQDFPNPFDR